MADETEKQTRMEASRQKKGTGRKRKKKKKNTLNVPHFLKRMVLISYGLMFITKEIRTICLHTPKGKKEGKGESGGGSDWKGNLERYITDIP